MAEPAGYQPRSMFSQMLQQRQQEQTQKLVARTLNEEIERGVGDQTNVDLAKTLPQAYFSAARRLAALGNATEAQALYQAGVQAVEATGKHNATLDNLRASTANLDESPTEYLEAMRKRDELSAQLPSFGENTPTGQAMRRTIGDLEARMARLNASGSTAALPDNLVEYEQYNASLIADDKPPIPYYQFHNEERATARDPQNYRTYVENERNAGRTPLPYERWTPTFQGQLQASQNLGGEGVKSLFEQETAARTAVVNLHNIQRSVQTLQEGVRAGPGVNVRQYVARGMAEFFGDDPSAATVNTDVYLAEAGQRTIQIARALAPVTELDLAKVEQIVGAGLGSATPESLLVVLKELATAQTRVVDGFNSRLARLGDAYQDVSDVFKPFDAPKVDFGTPSERVRIRVDASGNEIQ